MTAKHVRRDFHWILATVCLLLFTLPLTGNHSLITINSNNRIIYKKDSVTTDEIIVSSGITFFQSNLIIISNSADHQKMLPTHVSFGVNRTYITPPEKLGFSVTPFIQSRTFSYDPSGMSIPENEKIVYFTMNNGTAPGNKSIYSFKFSSDGNSPVKIIKGTGPAMLSFCDMAYNDRQPAVSADGDFMIFASDRPGSVGGYDLYYVNKNDEKWGTPVNLGTNLNTPEDELYPFLDNQNNLYFSTSGYTGFGNLDIYMCKFLGDRWEQPVNLMKNINSSSDDFCLRIDPVESKAYYISRDQIENKGILLSIEAAKPGEISNELLADAFSEYEIAYGTGFVFSSPKQIRLPIEERGQAMAEDDLQGEDVTQQPLSKKLTEDQAVAGNDKSEPDSFKQPPGESADSGEPAIESTAGSGEDNGTSTSKSIENTGQGGTDTRSKMKPENRDPEKSVNTEPEAAEMNANKPDAVIFRVQITSSRNPQTVRQVDIAGKSYPVFEYYYKGAYRQTVGAFSNVENAKSFQNKCRSNGYNQAFVAAFIDDKRVTDPAVFRR